MSMIMDVERVRRRARGTGCVYKMGEIWWIAYHDRDGKRHHASSGATDRQVAEDLVRQKLTRDRNQPNHERAQAHRAAVRISGVVPHDIGVSLLADAGWSVTGWRDALRALHRRLLPQTVAGHLQADMLACGPIPDAFRTEATCVQVAEVEDHNPVRDARLDAYVTLAEWLRGHGICFELHVLDVRDYHVRQLDLDRVAFTADLRAALCARLAAL